MRPVILIASPYEAELCRRALADIGAEVRLFESWEALEAELGQIPTPLVVVVGIGQVEARESWIAAQQQVRAPVFVIGGTGTSGPAVQFFQRPIDTARLADAIEKLAVQAEFAEVTISQVVGEEEASQAEPPLSALVSDEQHWDEKVIAAPVMKKEDSGSSPVARIALKKVARKPSPTQPQPVQRIPTEVIADDDLLSPPASVALTPTPDRAAVPTLPSFLRADDALSDGAGLRIMDMATQRDFVAENLSTFGETLPPAASPAPAASPPAPVAEAPAPVAEAPAPVAAQADDAPEIEIVVEEPPSGAKATEPADDERSTFARRLDRELSELQKRFFPGGGSHPQVTPAQHEYDEALSDIDLDAFGLDTVPGSYGDSLDEGNPDLERDLITIDVEPQTPGPESSPGISVASSDSLFAASDSSPRLPELQSDSRLPDSPLEAGFATDAPSFTPVPLSPSMPRATTELPAQVPTSGSLAEKDLAELVAELCRAGFSGRLILSRSDGDKVLFFESGTPCAASSTFSFDRLADFLLRQNVVRPLDVARIPAGAGAHEALIELAQVGLIKEREVFALQRQYFEALFYSCFGWDSGQYRITDGEVAGPERVRPGVHPWAWVLEGIRRKYDLERLVNLVGPPDIVLAPTTLLDRAAVEAKLLPEEQALIRLIDGERTLAQVKIDLAGPRLRESQLYACLWGLLSVGALRVSGAAQDIGDVHHVATLVAPSDGSSDRRQVPRISSQPRDAEIDRERVRQKRVQVEDCDYFSLLGVERTASRHEIERAFDRLRNDFAPEHFGDLRSELDPDLREILFLLDEAHRVLIDDDLRRAYRASLRS